MEGVIRSEDNASLASSSGEVLSIVVLLLSVSVKRLLLDVVLWALLVLSFLFFRPIMTMEMIKELVLMRICVRKVYA